jgi:hypothetical protein
MPRPYSSAPWPPSCQQWHSETRTAVQMFNAQMHHPACSHQRCLVQGLIKTARHKTDTTLASSTGITTKSAAYHDKAILARIADHSAQGMYGVHPNKAR